MMRTDIPAYGGTATELAAILAEAHGQAVVDSGGIEPDTYVVSAADWLTLANESVTVDVDSSTMNGCDVIRRPALTTGQALVGAVQSASVVLRNGSIMVEGHAQSRRRLREEHRRRFAPRPASRSGCWRRRRSSR